MVGSMATGNLLFSNYASVLKLMNATVDLARLPSLPCRAGGV